MQAQTHLSIDRSLCGEPLSIEEGRAVVHLRTTSSMGADAEGLVHGGFVFGAADYAAMLAVNHPHVVLGSADCRFTAPVAVGDVVEIIAERTEQRGRKHVIAVSAKVAERTVLTGTLTTFVLDQHVLDQ